MTVGLLLITHDRIGQELLDTATTTLSVCPLRARVLSVPEQVDPAELYDDASDLLHRLDDGAGVLVLTDAYGSTPSNVASRLAQKEKVAVIAGLNLPMLLRVLNYPDLPLFDLAEKAVTGGRDGIIVVEARRDD